MESTGFGKRLRDLRHSKGIGIKVLAKAVGVDHSYISKIERAKVLPSISIIRKLANHLGTDPDPLLIAAGKLPPDIQRIFYTYPKEASSLLRESFGEYGIVRLQEIRGVDKA